jgi:tetratricopeptide (TPR) repeat protein
MQLEPGGAATLLEAKSWSQRCWRRQLPLYSLSIALCPLHPEPYFWRGRLYEQMGQLQQAIADWTNALHWQSVDSQRRAELYFRRGHAFLALKDYKRGALDLRLSLEMRPGQPGICNELAWLDVTGPEEVRDPHEALRLAREAVAREPANWNFVNTLGVAQYRLGQYEEAIPTLERSLQHNSAPAFDLIFLAMSHARLRQPAKAKDCFERAVNWIQEHEVNLPPNWRTEFAAFRTEAQAVLANTGVQ